MSRNFLQPQQENAVCIYEGAPRRPDAPRERGSWRRFVDLITPWLKRKRELGDDYLEATVLEKRANAIKTLAEAEAKHAEALRTAAETAELAGRLEEKKLHNASVVSAIKKGGHLSDEIAAQMSELEDKLQMARLKYGVRILQLPATEQSGTDIEPSAALDEEKRY